MPYGDRIFRILYGIRFYYTRRDPRPPHHAEAKVAPPDNADARR